MTFSHKRYRAKIQSNGYAMSPPSLSQPTQIPNIERDGKDCKRPKYGITLQGNNVAPSATPCSQRLSKK